MRLRKSSLITKLILLAVMVYAIVTVVTLQTRINQLKETREALAQQVAAAEQDNRQREAEIENLNTDEAIKAIARERLNLVEDGEVIFVDSGN